MATLASKGTEQAAWGNNLAHYATLSLLGPAWFCCGKLAQRAKLPQITGYVIGGIICGPSGLNLLRDEAQQTLVAIDHSCLAIIALTAGAELHFDNIKRVHKQVISITLWISVCTWISVFAAMMLLVPYVPFLAALDEQQISSIASLAAMLMVARSPASAIAVVKETGGKGPYCSLILAVVVMKDVLVFICFALNLEFTRMMQISKGGRMRFVQIVQPFVSLASSVILGAVFGVALSTFVGWRASLSTPISPFARRLPPYVSQRVKTIGVACSAVVLFWLAHRMSAEPLLACVMTGIVTANYRNQDPGKAQTHESVAEHMARLMTAVNTTFFGLAGSTLRLGALMATIWIAILVWISRLFAIFTGSWLGAWIGGTPSDIRRKVWQGMITQAGVAMGLAKTVATRFPDWGPEFATLMVAIILLNLCIGPPLFRSAIFSAGEARTQNPAELQTLPKADGSPRSPPATSKEESASSNAEKGLSRNVSALAGRSVVL